MAQKCTAHRTNGEACGNYAMRGGRVCRKHGGAAPAVRAAAAMRLAEAQLEKDRRRQQHREDQLVAEEAERRLAVQPWIEELGPRYLWQWNQPTVLRRIAAEMRQAAAELTMLASSSDGRTKQCTSP